MLHENVAGNEIEEVEAESHKLCGKGYLIPNCKDDTCNAYCVQLYRPAPASGRCQGPGCFCYWRC